MPVGISFGTAATGSDGRIYVMGGDSLSGLNTVQAYNPRTNRWSIMPPMPDARYGVAATTGADGRIYVMGGHDAHAKIVNTAEAYNPRTDRWSKLAPMPTGRFLGAAALGPNGRIYVVGGYGGPPNIVQAYNPRTNRWSTAAPIPTPRGALAAATGPDGRICAIGGYAGHGVSRRVEAYDARTNRWSIMPPMPTPRSNLAAATGTDGCIYALGGFRGNDSLNTVEVYDAGAPSSPHPSATPIPASTPTPHPQPTRTPVPRHHRLIHAWVGFHRLSIIDVHHVVRRWFHRGDVLYSRDVYRGHHIHGIGTLTLAQSYQYWNATRRHWVAGLHPLPSQPEPVTNGPRTAYLMYEVPRSLSPAFTAIRITVTLRFHRHAQSHAITIRLIR